MAVGTSNIVRDYSRPPVPGKSTKERSSCLLSADSGASWSSALFWPSAGGTGRVWKPRPYFYVDDLGGLTVRGEFVGGGRARDQDGAFHQVREHRHRRGCREDGNDHREQYGHGRPAQLCPGHNEKRCR